MHLAFIRGGGKWLRARIHTKSAVSSFVPGKATWLALVKGGWGREGRRWVALTTKGGQSFRSQSRGRLSTRSPPWKNTARPGTGLLIYLTSPAGEDDVTPKFSICSTTTTPSLPPPSQEWLRAAATWESTYNSEARIICSSAHFIWFVPPLSLSNTHTRTHSGTTWRIVHSELPICFSTSSSMEVRLPFYESEWEDLKL